MRFILPITLPSLPTTARDYGASLLLTPECQGGVDVDAQHQRPPRTVIQP